jgi:hypothetical protein
MASEDFNSRNTHRMLTLLNSSLKSVIVKLEILAASEVLSEQYLEGLKKRSQEIEEELKSIFKF